MLARRVLNERDLSSDKSLNLRHRPCRRDPLRRSIEGAETDRQNAIVNCTIHRGIEAFGSKNREREVGRRRWWIAVK
jgi:hypothetical protein